MPKAKKATKPKPAKQEKPKVDTRSPTVVLLENIELELLKNLHG